MLCVSERVPGEAVCLGRVSRRTVLSKARAEMGP